MDPRVEWFKGGKKVIRNKISVYLNGEKNASINEFIENRLKGENAGKFIDDLKQIIKDYKLEGFDSFLKSKEPIEVLKKTYKQDINIAVNKGYDEGRFNIPIKTSVQDLHSSLSALLAATRKGTTEEATRVYKPLIDLYGKHFLDNEEIGGSVKLVNDLYKTEKIRYKKQVDIDYINYYSANINNLYKLVKLNFKSNIDYIKYYKNKSIIRRSNN